MNEAPNPYAAPQTLPDEPPEVVADHPLVPAGQGSRLVNYFIDTIGQIGLAVGIGVLAVLIGGEEAITALEETPDIVLGLPIFFAYYLLLEGTTSRTLGKWVTGTKVVNEDGGRPTTGQIIGRTLARLIPLEAFSFLGRSARGWHDSIPKTYVVKIR